ncbi:MAG: hypothetical protein ACJA1F_003051 [Paracoccaceae bacterium]|jgi:hypothetical protein|tara:strand:+ start:744 stop:947 length:204 start_codon:yes stop_codon:yes gene_type:complete
MGSDPLFIVVVIAALIVAGILLVGIAGFGKGGDFNRKHANKLMRYRLAAQFVAIILIMVFVTLQRGG